MNHSCKAHFQRLSTLLYVLCTHARTHEHTHARTHTHTHTHTHRGREGRGTRKPYKNPNMEADMIVGTTSVNPTLIRSTTADMII